MAGDTEQGAKPEEMAETKHVEKTKRAKNKKALVKKVIQQIGEKLEKTN